MEGSDEECFQESFFPTVAWFSYLNSNVEAILPISDPWNDFAASNCWGDFFHQQ